ncbi:MAG: L,D-transpeptidase family protein [bacterium]|nr:L,D-transpeptidase family protein [bacterium]
MPRVEHPEMVRIRILRGKAAAGIRSLRATGFGGLIVASAILAVSLGSLGEGREEGAATSAASLASPPGPRGAAVVEPEAVDPTGVDLAAVDLASVAAVRPVASTPDRSGKLPSGLLQLPASAASALVFDLHDNRMHLFESTGVAQTLVGDYFVAVGKNGIDKRREGDEKTPVGIYFISSYIPGGQLPAIYGVGAFPINYPNAWDRRLGHTGSGIWIHGTDKDEESLLPLSSRGCLTLHNTDFLTMARHARIRHTPVIVSDRVSWAPAAEVEARRASLAAVVETWRRDWESLDTDAYLRHYSEAFETDDMDLGSWSTHKRRVNAHKSYIRVGVENVGIYGYPGEQELYLVTFEQDYQSSNFRGRRWKHQYWRREGGDWRIVHEGGT